MKQLYQKYVHNLAHRTDSKKELVNECTPTSNAMAPNLVPWHARLDSKSKRRRRRRRSSTHATQNTPKITEVSWHEAERLRRRKGRRSPLPAITPGMEMTVYAIRKHGPEKAMKHGPE